MRRIGLRVIRAKANDNTDVSSSTPITAFRDKSDKTRQTHRERESNLTMHVVPLQAFFPV
jgi:hypothetical protein